MNDHNFCLSTSSKIENLDRLSFSWVWKFETIGLVYEAVEVEKVNSVSGNLGTGPKAFCKIKGVRNEKSCFFVHKWILGLLNAQKITYFLNMKVPWYSKNWNLYCFSGILWNYGWKICPFSKNTDIISFTLPRICLLVRKCRRRIQKLSVTAWFFKNFLTTRLPGCHTFSTLGGTVGHHIAPISPRGTTP